MEDYRDPEVLRRLYVDEGLTQEQMAERLCVSQSVIGVRMRAAGIKGRRHGSRKKSAKRYWVGGEYLTIREMAERSGICMSTIGNRIARGVPFDRLMDQTKGPVLVDVGGKKLTVAEISRRTGLKEVSIYTRIRKGVRGEDLLKGPQPRGRKRRSAWF